MQPLPKGNRVAMVANGVGPCVISNDYITRSKLCLTRLQDESIEYLTETYPPFFIISNPVDVTGSATSRDYQIALETFIRDPNVDIMVPYFVFQDTPLDEGIVDVLDEASGKGKTLICWASGGPYTRKMSKEIESRGIPVFSDAHELASVVDAIAGYSKRVDPEFTSIRETHL